MPYLEDSTTSGRPFQSHAVDGDLITLREPNGTDFDVILHSVRRAEGDPVDVRIVIEMGWPTYDRTIDIFGFFHAAEDARGEGAERFIEGKRVQVEARLGDAVAREHALAATPAELAAQLIALSEGEQGHPLLQTESWYALHVSQAAILPDDAPEGSALREGYSTTWAAQDIVGA